MTPVNHSILLIPHDLVDGEMFWDGGRADLRREWFCFGKGKGPMNVGDHMSLWFESVPKVSSSKGLVFSQGPTERWSKPKEIGPRKQS